VRIAATGASAGLLLWSACSGAEAIRQPSGDACAPGATQVCVGPGGCRGGQSCLGDGSGFGPCDCGGGGMADSDSTVFEAAAETAMFIKESGSQDGASDSTSSGTSADATPEGIEDAAACEAGAPPGPTATSLSNPAVIQTSTTYGFILHKELNGFPNYGSQDGAADILYNAQVGAWTFAVPSVSIRSATVVASLVANDSGMPPDETFLLWSDHCVHAQEAKLPHGMPYASRFTNWVQVSVPADLKPGGMYTLTLLNTTTVSNAGGWIGVDWVELHVVTQ
jgi:hypothetical protein